MTELPRQDYRRQWQGPPISGRALLTTTIEEGTHESIPATFEEREATQGETSMTTRVDQLAAFMAQIVQRQEERQQWEEEHQQPDEKSRREQERD